MSRGGRTCQLPRQVISEELMLAYLIEIAMRRNAAAAVTPARAEELRAQWAADAARREVAA